MLRTRAAFCLCFTLVLVRFLPGLGFFIAENASGGVDSHDATGNFVAGVALPQLPAAMPANPQRFTSSSFPRRVYAATVYLDDSGRKQHGPVGKLASTSTGKRTDSAMSTDEWLRATALSQKPSLLSLVTD